jgi:hypothetical protein
VILNRIDLVRICKVLFRITIRKVPPQKEGISVRLSGRSLVKDDVFDGTRMGGGTVATQSFRTAERSLWENGYFENSPKIEFSSDENDFWTGGS